MDVNTVKAANAVQITYTITFPQAQAHYVAVEMSITNLSQNVLDLKMPVWTPGSYLVREFAKNIETFDASTNGRHLASKKISKNCWRINTEGLENIKINYTVYANEISVRTSSIDASHAFLANAGIFIYPDKMLHVPSTIHIIPYKGWAKVSTSLDMVNNDPFTRTVPNYDILFDSPIEIGNQDIFGFTAAGVKYEVAMCGGGNYDKERLKKDMAKIVEQETTIYGENPNKHYVFIVHNYLHGSGGLEHLSSTVLGVSRDAYNTEQSYQRFLSLAAHEHFHLWNVKRLRPIALGPFDYDNENYTTDLWIAEGFTAYYEDIVLRHAGIITPDNYLAVLANDINTVENQPGKKIQSLADASYDAWIKAYRLNENSANSTISYYSKGSVIAMLLDLEIINDSNTKYSLDDVMKYMYDEYYKTKKRGYTDAEFKQGLEKFAGKNLDAFYTKYIYGVDDIDYNHYLNYAGYKLTDQAAASNDASLGIVTASANGKITVTTVLRGGAGWIDGINVSDEITAVNGTPLTDINAAVNGKKPGDKISLSINRDGQPLVLTVTLLRNPRVKYKVDALSIPTVLQLKARGKWLNL